MRMMLIGQRYRCQNVECGAEIEVKKASIECRSNPRCCCGAEMKKPYTPPVLRTFSKDAAFVSEFRHAADRY